MTECMKEAFIKTYNDAFDLDMKSACGVWRGVNEALRILGFKIVRDAEEVYAIDVVER